MRHVFLHTSLEAPRLYETASGAPVEIYNEYSNLNNIVEPSRLAAKSRKDYGLYAANFMDYCYEVGLFGKTPPTPEVAKITVQMYYRFLTEGKESTDFILRRAAINLDRNAVSRGSANTYIAGVNDFLFKADELIQDKAATAAYFGKASAVKILPLTPLGKRTRSSKERAKLRSNTMLGNLGIISNWETKSGIRGGKTDKTINTLDFPSSYLLGLIEKAPSPLYACAWALQAGGGLRISETLATKISLINIKTRTIHIEDPDYLRSPQSKKTDDLFGAKGRNTAVVVMFEPFKSIFFNALADYLEVRPNSALPYLFVSDDKKSFGQPLITAKKGNTITRQMNRALAQVQLEIGVPLKIHSSGHYTTHSLRHFYGMWARNCVHIQGRNTIGLELAEIQVLMGHKELSSTERYARLSRENVMLEIEASQRAIVNLGFGQHIDLYRADCYAEIAEELRKRAQ